ncbi:succinyl-CoA synthetase subunit alpha [Blastococcus saxobsidens]|uniref:Succinyl-CoA synthetase, alpha subunit n=1 Tax=Blastococcus saxobsidens (strain DD2) TaxID=1146883 RepID=H6RKC3_BLASD|nr:succinyl-CoA synthetase subunit alpha [Blastococcus saxobsidens]CCG01146.1 Succinyl-CoA synthetase, alpha subunit [Blastococcus saxobsidens DD2]
MSSPAPARGDAAVSVQLRSGVYADSVKLMQVSRRIGARDGVSAVLVAMATPLNLELAAGMGLAPDGDVSPEQLLIAVRAEDDDALAAALADVDAALAERERSTGTADAIPHRTVGAGLDELAPDVPALAIVSVPGAYAAVEAADAIAAGRSVLVFSDGVPVEQEVALKRAAHDAGVLVMGPDCGTAIVSGVALGFANVVRPGTVGLVAASGTGAQQVSCLLDMAGVGVSHVLGVGGRDLSEAVGGLATLDALAALDADPATERVLLVSKPPAPSVAAAVTSFADGLGVPVRSAALSPESPDLTAAVEALLADMGLDVPVWPARPGPAEAAVPGAVLKGLYSGGTLADEAMLLASPALGGIRSNTPLEPGLGLGTDLSASGHLVIDFGDDALTVGRAHPMIDPTLRLEAIAGLAASDEPAVLLLDVVLGHGADPDPAGALVPALEAARAARSLPVVVALIGTEGDPQGWSRQADALAAAGAAVFSSNAAATRYALDLLGARA